MQYILAWNSPRCQHAHGNACDFWLQAPGSHAALAASMELAAAPHSMAARTAHQGEPIQGGALSSSVQRRRSLRRLRRQQAATAAAVAGAVAGVSGYPDTPFPSSVDLCLWPWALDLLSRAFIECSPFILSHQAQAHVC